MGIMFGHSKNRNGQGMVIVKGVTQVVDIQLLVIEVIVVIVKIKNKQSTVIIFDCDSLAIFRIHFFSNKSTLTTMTSMTVVDYQWLKKKFTMTTHPDQIGFTLTTRGKNGYFA